MQQLSHTFARMLPEGGAMSVTCKHDSKMYVLIIGTLSFMAKQQHLPCHALKMTKLAKLALSLESKFVAFLALKARQFIFRKNNKGRNMFYFFAQTVGFHTSQYWGTNNNNLG